MGVAPPRVRLGCFPTPLERRSDLGEVVAVGELWVKRDDLTGYGWGGNKVRAVQYLVGDALATGADTVVLAAGPTSNFAATMASASVAAGLAVEQVCYGTEPSPEPLALAVTRASGARVHFTGDGDRAGMEQAAELLSDRLVGRGSRPYLVERGGASAIGSQGFAAAAVEICDQMEAAGVRVERVVMPLGSGGSAAGLIAGRALVGADWKVSVVSVSRPVETVAAALAERCRDVATLIGAPAPDLAGVDVVDGRGDGFGERRPEEDSIATEVELRCGLLVDPVYNAKSLLWLARDGADQPTLYWHTGGSLGAADRLRFDLMSTSG